MKLMIKLIKRVKSNIIYFLITSLLLSGCFAITPLLMRFLVDDVAISNNASLLFRTLIFIVLFMFFHTLIFFMNRLLSVKIVKKIDIYLKQSIIKSILYSKHKDYFGKNQSYYQNLLQRDSYVIASFINRNVIPIVSQLIIFLALLIVMIRLDLLLTIVCVSFLPIFYFIYSYSGKKLELFVPDYYKIFDGLTSYMLRILGGFEVIKAYRKEEKEIDMYTEWTNKYYTNEMKMTKVEIASSTISYMFSSVLSVGIFGFAVYLIMQGQTTLGTAVAFNVYIKSLFEPVQTISAIFTDIPRVKEAFNRVQSVINNDFMPLTKCSETNSLDTISFEDVSFCYRPENYILKNLNLKITKGKIYAFVGDSGAGKSTLAKLIMKFYTNEKGKILINNVDYNSISNESLRKLFAYIPQNSYLLPGTLYDNLIYGVDNISEKEIDTVLEELRLKHFIDSLPHGLETKINEIGSNLSGGEKQRIAIARALLTKSECIIADEMTGNLDINTEASVMEAMFRAIKGKTAIIIAHRLQTIVNADVIFVFEKGKIIEKGTHVELLKNNKYYKKLWEKQLEMLEDNH